VLVIDALDEAASDDTSTTPLVNLVAEHFSRLPGWLGVVVTTRPEPAITRRLSRLQPLVLDPARPENRSDLLEYIVHRLNNIGHTQSAEKAVAEIDRASQGNFLYAKVALDGITLGVFSLEQANDLPEGLTGIYLSFFERQFRNVESFKARQRPLLELVLAAHEPLPLVLARRCLGWDDYERDEAVEPLGSLFPTQGATIAAFHQSVADWAMDSRRAGAFRISRDKGRKKLGAILLDEFRSPSNLDAELVRNWAPRYFDATEVWQEWAFLRDAGKRCFRFRQDAGSWICWACSRTPRCGDCTHME